MSESDGGDPDSSSQNVAINKAAQAEAGKIDVLVCGQCHYVFHFVEEFVEHKSQEECGKPAFRTSITEDKPQVWAFLLWKSTVSLKEKESSWALYQRWCKLDNDVRSAWTTAGQAIRQTTALSLEAEESVTKLESQVEILNKSSSLTSEAESEVELGTAASDEESPSKDTEKSPVKPSEVVIIKRRRGRPRRDEVAPKVEPVETPPVAARGRPRKIPITPVEKVPTEKVPIKKEPSSEETLPKEDKKPGPRVIKMTRAAATLLKTSKIGPKRKLTSEFEDAPRPSLTPKATRSKKKGDDSEEDDFVVEKILAKRLNQKTKEYEYLLKWEGYPHEQNTWEPVHNMKECDTLVENFERSLAKQKANQQAAGHKVITKVIKMPAKPVVAGPSMEPRPIRSSKVKAMENVKSWCGTMAGKRKGDEDSDSDESSSEKRVKIEPPSDHMDEDSGDDYDDKKTPGLLKSLSLVKSPVGGLKKQVVSNVSVNGMTKAAEAVKKTLIKSPVSQPPVLVANSKGIIKLDSRQVPNLSSGVYIVSNQAGIVKLNSQSTSPLGTASQTSQKTVTSGIVRKIATELSPKQVEAIPEVHATTTPDVKLLPKGSPSGLVRIPTPSALIRKRSPLAPLTGPRPLRVLGPRPLAMLQQRPGLKPGQRPPFVPRPPQILRPPIRPGVSSGPRILMKPNNSPAAQVKSGIRPIQAMLGGSLASPQNVITVSLPKTNTSLGGTSVRSSHPQKLLVPIKKKLVPKPGLAVVPGLNGKQRDSKLVDSDSLHMEFQEIESSSSEDDGVESLPELPAGEAPSPPGSPLPLTLCPLTGKILGRAEGEPTPPPSPEPSQILPDLDGGDEDCLKVEMSPGGTTGTVVNMAGEVFEDTMDSVQEDGVTVTKLASNEGGSEAEDEDQEQEYVTITGEDGVVYQMVTQGNTLMEGQILMGDDGQEVYVTSTDDQHLTLDTAVAEAVSQLMPGDTEESQDMSEDSTQAQVVAQIVEEGETTPGGMRRVVLLLPDGNFMMTEVDEDQYAALDLDSSDTSPTK